MIGETQELVDRLGHSDKDEPIRAALAIGGRRDMGDLDRLVTALSTEPDFFVRETITWALVRLGYATLPALMDLANHESAQVRHDAVHALSKLGYDDAALVLWERLGDSNSRVVAKASYALGLLRNQGSVPELVDLLSHEYPEVRTAAAEALERIAGGAAEGVAQALVTATTDVRERAAAILGSINSDESVHALRHGLQDDDWQVRIAVLMALSRLGNTAATEAISTAHHDHDSRVRMLAGRLDSSTSPGPDN